MRTLTSLFGRIFLWVAGLLFVFYSEPLQAQTVPIITRGPYLQQLTPHSIVIRWRTDIPSKSKVIYGTTLLYGGVATDTVLTTEHIVKLTGLIPSRKYYYTVGTPVQTLAGDSTFYFFTSPAEDPDAPVRIWATGDFGIGSLSQAAVRDAMKSYTGNIPVNLWVWLGDNAYWTGTDQQYQSYVFEMYPEQLRSIPLYPAPGNHDYGNAGYQSAATLTTAFPYFDIFTVPQQAEAGGVPSQTPKYYSYDYGNIHFLSLDSYGTPNDSLSDMYQWIENDLRANTKKWVIAYFHHPPYSKGTHNSDTESELIDMRTSIVPLLEKYSTDLVLSGHSHNNERSYFIHGHYGSSQTFSESMKVSTDTRYFYKGTGGKGTVYAICGTSGQDPGGFQPDGPMPCMYFNNNTDNCSMLIDIQGDFLTASYLNKQQQIVDRFTISKSGSGAQQPLAFSIFQQPGNSNITFSFSLLQPGDIDLEIYNASGQLAAAITGFRKNLPAGIHLAELSKDSLHLASGMYIIKAISNNQESSAKLTLP